MFGSMMPLPMRLGAFGDPREIVSAEQWARLTSDLTMISYTAPFAKLRIKGQPSTLDILYYAGLHGVGTAAKPIATYNAAGGYQLDWPAAFSSPYLDSAGVQIRAVKFTVIGSTPLLPEADFTFLTQTPNRLVIGVRNLAGAFVDAELFLTVY